MSRPRFYVATVDGYPDIERRSSTRQQGLTAHVLDRAYLHAVVATYRSEEYLPVFPARRNRRVGAIRRARDKARELNAWDRAR